MDRLCGVNREVNVGAGETPNLRCSASIIASKGSVRVEGVIEADVNSISRIKVRLDAGGAAGKPLKYQ